MPKQLVVISFLLSETAIHMARTFKPALLRRQI